MKQGVQPGGWLLLMQGDELTGQPLILLLERRQRNLEAEIRSLRKQLAQKDEVIEILKKSVGILSKP